ncbi:MAG: coenzyme F420-0:L-glutamate ligase [Candidatus Tumulicola sp.]
MSVATRSLAIERPGVPAGLVAIPVRTRLVRPGDDLVAIVAAAVTGIARYGDVVAVSETALAISQGEFVPAEYVRPTPLAYALSRRAGALATVNQPESMQLVIDRAGRAKVLYATLAHLVGRAFGRRGAFYQVMGGELTAMDGYTGTMPPFERAIVFAPRDPGVFAQSVFECIGTGCAVVDANDLEKVKVLAASRGVDPTALEAALRDNPHGNGDEQTPVVVLKWRAPGVSPLFENSALA